MASAPVDIPVQVKGLSDLQKLERRMEALEREVTRLQTKTPKAANNVRRLGQVSRGAAGGVKTLGVAIKSTLAPLLAATATIGGLTAGFRAIAGQDFSEAKVRSLGVNSAQLVENLREVSKELQGKTRANWLMDSSRPRTTARSLWMSTPATSARWRQPLRA